MIEYIVAHKETFIVLGIMAFLGIMMFFLSGISRKDAAKRRAAANKEKPATNPELKL